MHVVKALTLTQPWASLVALGEKRFETRSWPTSYRGPLAIHAGKGLGPIGGKRGLLEVCATEPFASVLAKHRLVPADLPLGQIIVVVTLAQTARTELVLDYLRAPGRDGEQEIAFGDYTAGRWAYELTNLRAVGPIECTGALGFWDVPAGIAAVLA